MPLASCEVHPLRAHDTTGLHHLRPARRRRPPPRHRDRSASRTRMRPRPADRHRPTSPGKATWLAHLDGPRRPQPGRLRRSSRRRVRGPSGVGSASTSRSIGRASSCCSDHGAGPRAGPDAGPEPGHDIGTRTRRRSALDVTDRDYAARRRHHEHPGEDDRGRVGPAADLGGDMLAPTSRQGRRRPRPVYRSSTTVSQCGHRVGGS